MRQADVHRSRRVKLVITQLKLETNTYSPVPTPLARFATGGGVPPEGDAAVAAYRGTDLAIAALIVARRLHGQWPLDNWTSRRQVGGSGH